jgi:hypothetical protein
MYVASFDTNVGTSWFGNNFNGTQNGEQLYTFTYSNGNVQVTRIASNYNSLYSDLSGNITNYNPSDARLKRDLTPLPDMLERIRALTPLSFHWIESGELDWGFTSQDIQAHLEPALIQYREDGSGMMGYDRTKLAVFIIKAIQEIYEILRRNNLR